MVIYNLWTLCIIMIMLIPKSTLWLSFSKQWLSWTYRQELSTVYPHTTIYSLPICIFCLRLSSYEEYFLCESKLHITRVYEYTTFHMSFTTPYTPHLFIQVWCKQRVNLVPVFWHYQSFSNNLFFCILCPTEKYVYRWPLYFCQVL